MQLHQRKPTAATATPCALVTPGSAPERRKVGKASIVTIQTDRCGRSALLPVRHRSRSRAGRLVSALALLASALIVTNVQQVHAATVSRISGADRYATAAAISQ